MNNFRLQPRIIDPLQQRSQSERGGTLNNQIVAAASRNDANDSSIMQNGSVVRDGGSSQEGNNQVDKGQRSS